MTHKLYALPEHFSGLGSRVKGQGSIGSWATGFEGHRVSSEPGRGLFWEPDIQVSASCRYRRGKQAALPEEAQKVPTCLTLGVAHNAQHEHAHVNPNSPNPDPWAL